jgi:chromosome segregation ATPase
MYHVQDLAFTIEHVTVLPTAELAKAEKDQHCCVKDLQARLRCLERNGDDVDARHWSTSSSQSSANDSELEELREALEVTKQELEATQAALQQRDDQHQVVIQVCLFVL